MLKKRVGVLKLFVMAAVAVMAARLFQIQILEHDEWVARADEQHISQYTIKANRGEIYMMDGDTAVPVVMNEASWTVVVDPMVADPEETEKKLKAAIAPEKLTADFQDVFRDRNLRYYIVAKNVSRDEILKVRDAELSGVWSVEGDSRVYPEGTLAASTLGFVNAEGEGQYGTEGALNNLLSGTDGMLKTVTDVNQVALSIGDDNVRIPAVDGRNVVLTIDRNIQHKVEQVLQAQMEKLDTHHSSALVMDPYTGKILAMASYPSYDPANYGAAEDASAFVNDVLEGPYEPGSICKSFTMAAGINEGVMAQDTTYYNAGYTIVDGWKIDNADVNMAIGTITMRRALQNSLNTGSVQALRLLGGSADEITPAGKQKLYHYYHDRFGLGMATGVELYEAEGTVVPGDSEYAYNSTYANMTFGQGLDVTMVQMASAFSSMINGGNFYTPYVVGGEMVNGKYVPARLVDGQLVYSKESGLSSDDGEAYNNAFNPVRTGIITEETSATMRDMLHATRWYFGDDERYYLGGKTGTAQAIRNGAYVMDEFVSDYLGFGGATGKMPEYVIMVKMWEEGRTIGADADVRPMFEEINKYMIDYLQIEPGVVE